MQFKNHDLTYTEMNITEYKPNNSINYKLVGLSNGDYTSIDRGLSTDRYSSTLTFRGRKEDIRNLVDKLTELRNNSKEVEISEFQVNIFGDNVDHSGTIKCLVHTFGKEESPNKNIQTIKITFLPTDLIFKLGSEIPSLNCLSSKWSGYSDWNAHTVETYTNNYFVDREADTFVFEGTYNLSVEDNSDLLNNWRLIRGNRFTINESDFGTERMFGGSTTDTTHNVIFLDVSYDNLGPVRRLTTIKLVKVA